MGQTSHEKEAEVQPAWRATSDPTQPEGRAPSHSGLSRVTSWQPTSFGSVGSSLL